MKGILCRDYLKLEKQHQNGAMSEEERSSAQLGCRVPLEKEVAVTETREY